MPKLDPIQTSFAAGEITPKLNARSDIDIFGQGLEELTNMFPLRHGPVAKREGMAYTASYPGFTTGRLFTFHVSPSQSFVVVVNDDGLMRVNDNTGQVLENNIVLNPFFDVGTADWTDNSDNQAGFTWTNGTVELFSTRPGDEGQLGQLLDITGGAENDDHKVDIIGSPSSVDAILTVRIGTSIGAADIDEFELVRQINSFVFNPAGNGIVWLTLVYVGLDPLRASFIVDSVRCSRIGSVGVEFSHPWDASDLSELQAEMPPGEDVMFFTAPRQPQQELTFDKAADAWGFTPITFTAPPPEWAGTNFPSAVTFFQGRSWWGGTPNEAATFWASKSGVIRDMTLGSVADDGMEFELSSRGRIEWMEGLKNLLIGTEHGEFIVISEGGIIVPGDISVEQQSAYGSESAESRVIGNQVLYLSADGSKLRELDYSWTENGWLSRDLTFPAEHFGLESPMREIHYVKDPESIINCLNSDGEIFACTYDPNSKFVGWSRLRTSGRVLSMTVTQQRGASVLWLLVNRSIKDPTEFFLERFTETASSKDFLDAAAFRLNDPPSVEVTGVTHLADQTVSVTVDNAVHPDITLDANGDGTLNFPGSRIVVGLGYTARLKTLPMDPGSPGGGSSMGMRKRWNRIFIRLLDSALPLVNGERQPDRTPSTPMNQTEPDRTQDVETRNFGWDQFAQITVEQDLPRALTVTALFGEFAEERL